MSGYVKISKTVAMQLLRTARTLFLEGTGTDVDPNSALEDRPVGMIDEINPENADLFYWANELLRFSRLVFALMQNGLLEADTDSDEEM